MENEKFKFEFIKIPDSRSIKVMKIPEKELTQEELNVVMEEKSCAVMKFFESFS